MHYQGLFNAKGQRQFEHLLSSGETITVCYSVIANQYTERTRAVGLETMYEAIRTDGVVIHSVGGMTLDEAPLGESYEHQVRSWINEHRDSLHTHDDYRMGA